MYDAVFVLVEAFNKLLKKKPDQFRSYTMRRSSTQHSYTNSSYGNLIANGQNVRVLDCNTAKGWISPWEHGDRISRYLRKVRSIQCSMFNCSMLLCVVVPPFSQVQIQNIKLYTHQYDDNRKIVLLGIAMQMYVSYSL